MTLSLLERIERAARGPRRNPRDAFETVGPGRIARMLLPCPSRGPILDEREVPCCGGRLRVERKFTCSHVGNPDGAAWAIVCQDCILRNGEATADGTA
jgi:hypothetical protein